MPELPVNNQKTPHRKAVMEAATLGFLVLALALGASLIVYRSAASAMALQLHTYIQGIAEFAASNVDGDLHGTFTRPEQKNTPEYAEAIKGLARVRNSFNRVAYTYTLIRRDGQYYFVLDSVPDGDADHDGVNDKSQIMEQYDEKTSDPGLARAFDEKTVTSSQDPTIDKWGTFVSGYAPVYNSNHELVAVAGVDVDIRTYQQQMNGVRMAGLWGVIAAVIAACMMTLGVYRWRIRAIEAEVKLASTMQDLEISLRQAESASLAKSHFIANISHEIRTPINGIIGMAQLLAESRLGKESKHYAEVIQHSADHLLGLINEVLDFSKIESGHITLSQRPFNLRAIAQDAVDLMRSRTDESKVTVECKLDDELPNLLLGDEVKIRQVMLNLLGNAAKFTHQGVITLALHCDQLSPSEAWLRVEVTDTGIGVPKNRQADIFEKFTQGDSSTTRRYGGTGLGLAICKELVHLMNGEIGVISEEGTGATFWFTLRLAIADEQELAEAKAKLRDSWRPGALRVLVVEDNSVNQLVAIQALKKLGFRHVTVVASGEEAVRSVQEDPCDVMLLDLHMPAMDGFTTARAIRALGMHSPEPIIIACTADVEPETTENCIHSGIDGILTKPYKFYDVGKIIKDQWLKAQEDMPLNTTSAA
ncbi:response regulator [bacterium]|nr:response regulator [bacterium]